MELLILLVLILLNGVFAMSEIAVVSSRAARLQQLQRQGYAGAATAIGLHEAPSRFLSTVQVGITSIGILAGAIGDDALITPLAASLREIPMFARFAEGLAMTVVVIALTYFSVVIGELVPKRLALLAPERVAAAMAGPMNQLARVAHPLVALLAHSAEIVFRLLRIHETGQPPVTNEEIKVLMEQGAEAGVFHVAEQQLVANVLHLDDQHVRAVMTPRGGIEAVDLDQSEEQQRQCVAHAGHSRLLAYRGNYNNIAGILHSGDLLRRLLDGERFAIADCAQPAQFVPDTLTLSQLLEVMRHSLAGIALVVDEYGELQGLVTLHDLTDAIVGHLPLDEAIEEVVHEADGAWSIAGALAIERLRQLLEVTALPGEEDNPFHTAAGFALHQLGHIPEPAEEFVAGGYRYRVLEVEGKRIARLRVEPLKALIGEHP